MATERESVEAIQQALAVIKTNLRNIQQINTEAGRLQAANAAMGFRGRVLILHADMTEAMRVYWPEFADEIQAFGPRR
jgi:hypothetical protein